MLTSSNPACGKIAVVLKGYPRLSETFIAQELLSLEKQGLGLALFSLRHPTSKTVHRVHREIAAPVHYLPEYLYREPGRVLGAWRAVRRKPGYRAARNAWLRDLAHDLTPNRIRRFGQALVLAAELPADIVHLHAHFLHTPASVALYAAKISGLQWTCSAHAVDIWTTGAREKTVKLNDCRWTVTCTRSGWEALSALAGDPSRVWLNYHGLDISRFPPPPARPGKPRNGSDRENPVELLTVARAVHKKGLDVLIRALGALPDDLHWRWTHIGGGELTDTLRAQADAAGLSQNILWRGALPQQDVLAALRCSDVFVLPCRIHHDGDRDGLPNVLMEALSQGLACLSTTLSGVPELITDGLNGVLVEPDDSAALAQALERLIRAPEERGRMGKAGETRVRADFDHATVVIPLYHKFQALLAELAVRPDPAS